MILIRTFLQKAKSLCIILFLIIVFMNNCGGEKEKKEKVKIGVAVCLTGDVAPYGQHTIRGIRLAAEMENNAGGINGRKIELIVEDTKSEPRVGVVAVSKLIDIDKVTVVVGDVLSSTTLAMAPIAEKMGIVLLAPGASNPSMRVAGDYIFRNWVSDDFDGKAMAQFIWQEDVKTIGTLTQQNDYCLGLTKALIQEYERLGGSVISQQVYPTGVLDLRVQLERIRMSNPEAVYLSGEARGDGLALKQMNEIGYNPKTYTNMSVEMKECQEIAGEGLEGIIYSTPAFDPSSTEPHMVEFVEKYRDKYGETPDVTAAIGFDALRILVQVMRKYGTDSNSIKNGLYQVKDYPGVSGGTTFDDHGDVIKDIFIKKFIGGKAHIIRRFEFSTESKNSK